MRGGVCATLATGMVVVAAVTGCNAILDNKPGRPRAESTPAGGAPKPIGGEPAPIGTPEDPSGRCEPGKHACDGTCVAADDPAYGCGSADCAPCAFARARTSCRAGRCAIDACDDGYADCNQSADDGCEVDLSRATSCGACDATCPASTPTCAPSGKKFQCTTGCAPDAPLLCGTECVAPATSVNHCGGCNTTCPAVESGTAACVAGTCTFTCTPGFHACGARCVVPTDPSACGPTCVACPAPANAAATCIANACSFACVAGYGDCNEEARDGCETNFATDPLHCGGCGKPCKRGVCKDGTCTQPADAGP